MKVIGGQTDKLDAIAYTDVKIDRDQAVDPHAKTPMALSDDGGLLLKKGEQIQVDCQMAEELTAPVSAGTQIGTVKYLVDGDVYKVEYIVTSNDIPAIDFQWCLRQIIKRYSL